MIKLLRRLLIVLFMVVAGAVVAPFLIMTVMVQFGFPIFYMSIYLQFLLIGILAVFGGVAGGWMSVKYMIEMDAEDRELARRSHPRLPSIFD